MGEVENLHIGIRQLLAKFWLLRGSERRVATPILCPQKPEVEQLERRSCQHTSQDAVLKYHEGRQGILQ
jgi:hypothetical protein